MEENKSTEGCCTPYTKQPLVSFCVLCYNQKQYIKEGVKAALAQTYSPLEVIISDDCSTDGSFEEIQKIVSDYHGPHKVIVHRNNPNLGMLGNFQTLCSLSSGELIIKADGDDISYPNRAQVIVDEWIKTGRQALVVASSYDEMNRDGKVVREVIRRDEWIRGSMQELLRLGHLFLGCAMAVHRCLYDEFPRVMNRDVIEDSLYFNRALLYHCTSVEDVGLKFRTVSQKLIKYREGGISDPNKFHKVSNIIIRTNEETLREVNVNDESLEDKIKDIFEREIVFAKTYAHLRLGNFHERLTACWKLNCMKQSLSKRVQYLTMLFPGALLLAKKVLAKIMAIRYQMKRRCSK